MKHKNILNIGLTLVVGLLFVACSQNEDLLPPKASQMQNGFYVYLLEFNCEAPGYDAGTTRAVTYDWQNGATLFARFKSGSTYYIGFVTYTTKGWSLISTTDFLESTNSETCQLFYFQEENGDYYYMNLDTGCFDIYNNGSFVRSTDIKWNEGISLSEATAIYSTSAATYALYPNVGFTIKASLQPMTWRMRFSGTNGTTITLPGNDNDIYYYSGFSLDTSSAHFTLVSKDLTLKVSGNYTPYIYGSFKASSSDNKITVKNDKDIYSRTFNGSNLKAGSSGYFTIPTASNYSSNGWTKVATMQEMVLKDFLEKPFGIVEGVNLKKDSYETIKSKLLSLYKAYDSSSDPTHDEHMMFFASENESLKYFTYCDIPFAHLYISDKPVWYTFRIDKTALPDPYPTLDKIVRDFKDIGISMSYQKKNEGSTKASGSVTIGKIEYTLALGEGDTYWDFEVNMWITEKSNAIANCKFVPNKFLAYTDGCVTDWNVDTKVSKGYFKAYKKTDISSKSDAEIVADLIKTDEINASNLNNNVFYRGGDSYSANTNYVLCSVGFDSSGNQGELNKYEFKTRSSTLPMAALSDFKYNSNYWFYTITSKYSATSYYLYFNESTGVHDWSRWYFRYRIYFAIQNNELGMGTSDTVYSAWGDKQITRDESQFSICTWAIVSGKTLGNPDSYQGHIQSSAPSMISDTKQSAQPQSDRVSKQEGEALFKQGKLILVNGY